MIEQFHFFCDESGITKDSFLVIAGIVVRASCLSQIDAEIRSYRRSSGMHAELKWCKITNQRETNYRAFIDCFFDLNRGGVMHFHSLIVPYSRFDHKYINCNNKTLSLHKMFYQLILHRFCRLYGGNDNELIVRPDLSSNPLDVVNVRRMLNNDARRKFGMAHKPVKDTAPRDSAKCNLLQMNDVILGAVSAYRNRRHLRVGGRQAKRRLAEYVLLQSGLPSYDIDTSLTGSHRFTVWNFRSPLLRPDRTSSLGGAR